MRITAHRYHDISTGHRVYGHESKCACLHGHNYRIHFHCDAPALDALGRVIDFGVIKSTLCEWVERNWDHRTLLWERDPILPALADLDRGAIGVPFNPTAENMGLYLVQEIGPQLLADSGVTLRRVVIEETRKCGVTVDA